MPETLKLPVHVLRAGDVTTATRETVINVSAGVRTPRGKMDVVLEKDGRRYARVWGRNTLINIVRSTDG